MKDLDLFFLVPTLCRRNGYKIAEGGYQFTQARLTFVSVW